MRIVTAREQAKNEGQTFYLSDRKCRNGHGFVRYASNGACPECMASRSTEYKKTYIRPSRANPDRKLLSAEEKRQRANEYRRKDYKKRKHVYSARNARYHKRVKRATPKWLTAQQRAEIFLMYDLAAVSTKVFGVAYEVDHVVPLKGENVCGVHVPWNLRVVTRTENRVKHAKLGEALA